MNVESNQLQIRQEFDSYCKKVISNAAIDGHREMERKYKFECSLDDVAMDDNESLRVFDTYPSDSTVFVLEDGKVTIQDKRLADAFRSLQDELRDILLMHWFLDMVDKEIAERKHLSRRAVNRKRNKAFCLLKDLLGDEAL